MVCVVVNLLLKRNIGVLFGVLRGPRSDAPFFACYGSAIILWVLYIYFHCISIPPEFIRNLSYVFLPVSLWCPVASVMLCFEALFCCVLCGIFINLFPVALLWACTHVLSQCQTYCSGIHKMTGQSCHKVYIRQTGQNLTRYKEHCNRTILV
jgi:hypothetical protein